MAREQQTRSSNFSLRYLLGKEKQKDTTQREIYANFDSYLQKFY